MYTPYTLFRSNTVLLTTNYTFKLCCVNSLPVSHFCVNCQCVRKGHSVQCFVPLLKFQLSYVTLLNSLFSLTISSSVCKTRVAHGTNSHEVRGHRAQRSLTPSTVCFVQAVTLVLSQDCHLTQVQTTKSDKVLSLMYLCVSAEINTCQAGQIVSIPPPSLHCIKLGLVN